MCKHYMDSFVCNVCKKILDISLKCSDRMQCKTCYNSKRRAKVKEVSKNIDKNTVNGKDCIECGRKFDKNIFKWKETRWASSCNPCYNSKKYYAKHRENKRKEDETAYLEHNRLVHKKWVENNKERNTENNVKYRNTIEGICSTYLASATCKKLLPENKESFRALIIELIQKPCFYCGEKEPDKYNGLDRLNSSSEYTRDNCVPCCSLCNYMKNTLDIGSFLRKVREIAIYNNLGGEELKVHCGVELTGKSSYYSTYKYSAVKRNINFDISKDFFNKITSNSCYICGKGQIVGIDRLDNNVGYVEENCRPCCSYCNYMKGSQTYNNFLKHVENINSYINEKHLDLIFKYEQVGFKNKRD